MWRLTLQKPGEGRQRAGERGGMKVFVWNVSRLNDPPTPENEVRGRGRRSCTLRSCGDRERWTTRPQRCRVHSADRNSLYGAYLQTPARRKQMHSFPDSIKKKEINKEEGWCGSVGSAQRSAATEETINKKRWEKRRETSHTKAFLFSLGRISAAHESAEQSYSSAILKACILRTVEMFCSAASYTLSAPSAGVRAPHAPAFVHNYSYQLPGQTWRR